MKKRISLLLLVLCLLYPVKAEAGITLYSDEGENENEKEVPEIEVETLADPPEPEMGVAVDYGVAASFGWYPAVGGISENLMYDMDAMVVVTNVFSFCIPDSWKTGFYFDFSEDQVSFYSMAVRDSEFSTEGSADGLLCRIFRSDSEEEAAGEYCIGCDEEYAYYCQPFSGRANPEDEENYEIYQAMSSDVEEVIGSLVIESEKE